LKALLAFLRGRLASFGPAFQGWAHVWRTQPNAWVHAAITLAVIALGFWLRLSHIDWVLILITIGLVWVAEFLNTAIEAVVDLASPRQHKLAQIAKDVSAGAVVLAALIAVLVGLLLLGPPLWEKIAK
jgi:diacylglycerol kinase